MQAKSTPESQPLSSAAQQATPQTGGTDSFHIQPRLTIGAPNDIYEKEADEVAERVMRMPQREPLSPFDGSGIQRRCAACDEDDKKQIQTKPFIQRQAMNPEEEERPIQTKPFIQRQAEEDEELQTKPLASRLTPFVQRKSDGGGVASEGLTSRINASRGGGSPLSDGSRSFMESRFGADFSGVRVHTGGESVQMNRELNAQAFTVGRDVYFGEGKYSPDSSAGRGLLGHELTHVVQQGSISNGTSNGKQSTLQLQSAGTPSPPSVKFSDTLNYPKIAKDVHDGVSGWGTDEEGVYLALQKLNRDTEAIQKLKEEYQKKYNADLVGDIYDDFSGEELEYALQLLKLGTLNSKQKVGTLPTTADEYIKAANRLREAVEGIGTDEEAIYAVLLPFNRQKDLIDKLMLVYLNLHKENLRERLQDELSGSEADYALWLLADQPIFRDDKNAMAESKLVLAYVQGEALKRAKTPSSIDVSSNFYKVLSEDYLKDYFSAPTAAKGKEVVEKKIGRQIEGGTATIAGTEQVVIKPEGLPWRLAANEWELKALVWLNQQKIPKQLKDISDIEILKNLQGLPTELGAATEVLTKEKWAKLGHIDVPFLIGKPNLSQDFDSDVREGGKNISQLMHWATGVKYSEQSILALRELFFGYEMWHLEGFDVFGQDSLNDMIAEYQGALLGKELIKGSLGSLKSKADLAPFLNRSFLEARAWVGSLLNLRRSQLDNWILAKEQKPASMHWQQNDDIWHSKTIYQMLADGMKIEEVKKSFLVESAIEIYTLIFESEEWQRTNGKIELTSLEKALLEGKLNTLLEIMAKHEEGKASIGDLLKAKSALGDLKKIK